MFKKEEIIKKVIVVFVIGVLFSSCSFFNFLLPKTYRAESLVEEGISFARSGQWNKALISFKHALKLVNDARIYNDIGITYVHLGDLEKAFYYFQQASERDSSNPYYQLNLAVAYDKGKRYGLALEIYDKILKVKPGWLPALIDKAYTLSNLKKISDALAIYEAILRSNPRNVLALSSIAGLYARLGQFDKALEYYRRIIPIKGYPEIYLAMGAVYELKEDYDDALKYYKEAISMNPTFSLAYFLYGNLKITIGDIKEGVSYLKKSVELAQKGYSPSPYIGGNYFVLAGMEESLGYDKQAKEFYEKAFMLYPALKDVKRPIDVDAMMGLAVFLKNSNKLDEAEKKVKEILDVDNKNPTAYDLLGDIYFLKGEMGSIKKRQDYYKKAIESYRKSLALGPQQPRVYVKLGNIFFAQGNLEVVYYRQGKYHQAYLDYKEALRLNPKDPVAHLSLGLLYAAKAEYGAADTTESSKALLYSKAITELTIATSEGLGNFYTYYLLGLFYLKKGGTNDLKMAEYFANKSYNLNPNWNSNLYLLGMIFSRMNLQDKAEEYLARIKPKDTGEDKNLITYLLLLSKRG